ncbi:MAG: hypothetical protein IKR77_07025 [Bacteroidales bacterium]|nr:hypothetical protein [Bacteroidales bacterium]
MRPGDTLIVDGGTLTSACPGEMWQGIEVVGDRTRHQNAANQSAGSTLRNDMADGCTLPGCVVKSYNNKPLPPFFRIQVPIKTASALHEPKSSGIHSIYSLSLPLSLTRHSKFSA